ITPNDTRERPQPVDAREDQTQHVPPVTPLPNPPRGEQVRQCEDNHDEREYPGDDPDHPFVPGHLREFGEDGSPGQELAGAGEIHQSQEQVHDRNRVYHPRASPAAGIPWWWRVVFRLVVLRVPFRFRVRGPLAHYRLSGWKWRDRWGGWSRGG